MKHKPQFVQNAMQVIGRVHTPFKLSQDVPIQGTADDVRGSVAVLPAFADGLADLDGFDRIWLLYLSADDQPAEMRIVPRLDSGPRGVFATRSLSRPNPVGLTCVKLIRVEGSTLHVQGVDMCDGSIVLDIKPYVPRYDAYPEAWAGWLENKVPHDRAWQDAGAKGKRLDSGSAMA